MGRGGGGRLGRLYSRSLREPHLSCGCRSCLPDYILIVATRSGSIDAHAAWTPEQLPFHLTTVA